MIALTRMTPSRIAPLLLLGALLLAAGSCSGKSPVSPPIQATAISNPTPTGVTFRVAVPSNTPAGDSVFIAGDFQGWNPAIRLRLDETARRTLDDHAVLPAGAPIQFKFTRGGWDRVRETGPNGEELVRTARSPHGFQHLRFTVRAWADTGSPGRLSGTSNRHYAPFLGGRRIWVYLPRATRPPAVLPVLHEDGQNRFDVRTSSPAEWQVDEACEQAVAAGRSRGDRDRDREREASAA